MTINEDKIDEYALFKEENLEYYALLYLIDTNNWNYYHSVLGITTTRESRKVLDKNRLAQYRREKYD